MTDKPPAQPPALTPEEQLGKDIAALRATLTELATAATLADVAKKVDSLTTEGPRLTARLQVLAARGFEVDGAIQRNIAEADVLAPDARVRAVDAIGQKSQELLAEVARIETTLGQVITLSATPATAGPLLELANGSATTLRTRIEAADNDIRSIVAEPSRRYDAAGSALSKAEELTGTLSEAGVQARPTERPVRSVEAILEEVGDDSKAQLVVTSQRLLYLRPTPAGSPSLEADLAAMTEISATKEGFFKNEDHLYLTVGGDAPRQVHLHLYGQDSREWATLLEELRTAATAAAPQPA